jgi:hypothetical protein
MFSFAVLAPLALAKLRTPHAVLEAFAVLFEAARAAAVAPFHVAEGLVGDLASRSRVQGVDQDLDFLIACGFATCCNRFYFIYLPRLILLNNFLSERQRVPDQNRLHGLQPTCLVLGAVAAAHASAVAIAVPVVFEALAVEFEAASVRAVA